MLYGRSLGAWHRFSIKVEISTFRPKRCFTSSGRQSRALKSSLVSTAHFRVEALWLTADFLFDPANDDLTRGLQLTRTKNAPPKLVDTVEI
jgi:hypothetical protein